MDAIQSFFISALAFVTVLSVVVFVHEFGHFQAARWCKVAIDTFSIGFGKRLFGWRDKSGVEWKVGALPLGGYVKFTGDADAASTQSSEALDTEAARAEARRLGHFHAMPVGVRAFVVAAGPLTNFIFSILAFATVAMIIGRDATDYASIRPQIGAVMEGSAAAEAGLQANEVVEAADGVPMRGLPAFQAVIASSAGEAVTLTLRGPNGDIRVVEVTPRPTERRGPDGSTETYGALGVQLTVPPEERVIEAVGPLAALQVGAVQTWTIITDTVAYIGGIFTGRNSGAEIAGPIGIFMQSGQVAQASLEAPPATPGGAIGSLALNLFTLAAFLSVAVGFVNLSPIPILDGGHLVFYAAEALRGGKPVPPVAQEWAFRAGLAVMASLFLFATWNDVSRVVSGGAG